MAYKKVTMFQDFPDLLEIKDVVEALHVSRHSVYKIIKSRELKSFRMGRTHRVTKKALIDYIEAKESRRDYS